jgi:tRNA(Ile)-lysidine synthase
VAAALARIGPGLYGVACSGGADSMALAEATIAVAGATHVAVIAIDHGLSPGSADVVAGVIAWARERGATAVSRRVEVARSTGSIEAAARDARYRALDTIADEFGAVAVLTGHTARDQAETVLLRILRGTGPAGLAGIPASRGRYVRPLLAIERVVIEAYVAARRLPTWDDPMNADLRIARVRVRTEILPALARENPRLSAALVRLAASATEWVAAIDELARPFACFPIDCAALARQPVAIRKRALALALDAHAIGYDAVHLDRLDAMVVAAKRGEISLDLPGMRVARRCDRLVLPQPAVIAELEPPSGYTLRAWRPGDRMRPARLKGRSRKLSDLYIDAKVHRELRAGARVLVRNTDDTIVWAEHLGLAYGEAVDVIPTNRAS